MGGDRQTGRQTHTNTSLPLLGHGLKPGMGDNHNPVYWFAVIKVWSNLVGIIITV